MKLTTPKEISRITKKSAQYIDRELKKNPPTLTVITKGKTASGKKRIKIDLDGELTQKFIRLRVPDSEYLKPEKKKATRTEEKIKNEPAEEFDPLESRNPSGLAATGEAGELKAEKTREEIEKLRIDNQQKRGALIEKKLIVMVFNRLANIDENQFRALNVRACPKIIALDSKRNDEKVNEILELFGKEKSKTLRTETLKILNSGESEKTSEITEILEEDTGKVLKNIQREFGDYLEIIEGERRK